MNKPIRYSYCPIRYRHDPTSGEQLNVGILVYAPETGEVELRYDSSYSRMSEAFACFEGAGHRSLMSHLAAGIADLAKELKDSLFATDNRHRFADAGSIIRRFWPDQGLSYQAGTTYEGICVDIAAEADELFASFVTSQYAKDARMDRRNDEALWLDFTKSLEPEGIAREFRAKKIQSVDFKHVYKNGAYHVVEPVSLDYKENADLKNHVSRTIGRAYQVREVELTMYVLVGRPKRGGVNTKQYREAVASLKDLAVNSQVIEERDAAGLVETLMAIVEDSAKK